MSGNPEVTKNRKLDHIKLTVSRNVEARESTLLEYVRIVHNPLPEVDLDNVDLTVEFCGKKLRAPLMITAMTGGHEEAYRINRELARIAEKYGLAIGVGSQRAGLEDPSVVHTFRVVRSEAPHAFVVANLGAPQLSKGYGVREARAAVEMVGADALAIHLNAGQEAYQYEGDPYYSGVLTKILEIQEELDVPVLIKETGSGLSREAVRLLYRLGVKCFDTAGLGGTSWIKVEALRAPSRDSYNPPGPLADYWGNPTAVAVAETRYAAPDAYIVGSGGVRTGLDASKVIALGADIAGMALPFLRALVRGGVQGLDRFAATTIYQLKTVIFMVGGRSPRDLWRARISVWGRLYEELRSAGIDQSEYLTRTRLLPLVLRYGRF
ncbi:MAG: type 2 isopentenyl-diphosphate Delta-isomerase [Desulfurococcales archaeon]|nr:type 2 isopentenyl-diphosphate Delta-isomerase [Desulfurococcales archaeon]